MHDEDRERKKKISLRTNLYLNNEYERKKIIFNSINAILKYICGCV